MTQAKTHSCYNSDWNSCLRVRLGLLPKAQLLWRTRKTSTSGQMHSLDFPKTWTHELETTLPLSRDHSPGSYAR